MKSLLILVSLFLASCSHTPCANPDSAAGLITGVLANAGQCNAAGNAAILADVSSVCSKLNLCNQNASGTISMVLCSPIISAMETLGGQNLNARYPGCNFNPALNAPALVLTSICQTLPF